MKKLILLLVFSVVAFAQHYGGGHAVSSSHFAGSSVHVTAPVVRERGAAVAVRGNYGWRHFGGPAWRRPVIGPYRGCGWGWGVGLDWGWYNPYYDPYWWALYNYTVPPVAVEDHPCVKKTLKDSQGIKHDVLACRQVDGSYKVVSGQ